MALGREAAPEDTFALVFHLHHEYVYRLAFGLLGQRQDAEDVTQEVFLRVYKALPSYEPQRASLRTWLTRLVINRCRTHQRRSFLRRFWQRSPVRLDQEDGLEPADPTIWGLPEEWTLQTELQQTVKVLLDRLRPEHRTVLVLHYYLDLSCPEIARILDCAEGTVYSRLHRARRLLRAQLTAGTADSKNEVRR